MQILAKRPISLKRPPPPAPTLEELNEGLAACARLSTEQPEHSKLWTKMAAEIAKAKTKFYPEPPCAA